MPQLEKALAQKRGPNTAINKNKYINKLKKKKNETLGMKRTLSHVAERVGKEHSFLLKTRMSPYSTGNARSTETTTEFVQTIQQTSCTMEIRVCKEPAS